MLQLKMSGMLFLRHSGLVQSSPLLQVFRSRLKTKIFAWSYSHD